MTLTCANLQIIYLPVVSGIRSANHWFCRPVDVTKVRQSFEKQKSSKEQLWICFLKKRQQHYILFSLILQTEVLFYYYSIFCLLCQDFRLLPRLVHLICHSFIYISDLHIIYKGCDGVFNESANKFDYIRTKWKKPQNHVIMHLQRHVQNKISNCKMISNSSWVRKKGDVIMCRGYVTIAALPRFVRGVTQKRGEWMARLLFLLKNKPAFRGIWKIHIHVLAGTRTINITGDKQYSHTCVLYVCLRARKRVCTI